MKPFSVLIDIAIAQLSGRKRQSIVSILGVATGVGFFIGIASMMQGFQNYFIETVIDVTPHITVKNEYRDPPRQPAEIKWKNAVIEIRGLKPKERVRGLRQAQQIMAAADRIEGAHVAPTLVGQVILRYGSKDQSAQLFGIDPDREQHVSTINNDMLEGSLNNLYTDSNGIVMGEGLAQKLGIEMRDTLTVIAPTGVILKMKVVGIFRTGVTAIDNNQSYTLLKKSQILQDRINRINQVRIKLDDVDRAGTIASQLEHRFGYLAESWREANANVFGIFVIQNGIMYSTVGAILIVAGFGIFNIISIVIREKQRDIAILKSIGFQESDISRIFLSQGFVVGVIGTVLGWGLGYGLIELLASIEFDIEGFVRSKGFVLYRTWLHYAISAVLAIAAATLAAWLPARKAARLDPVDILRGGA